MRHAGKIEALTEDGEIWGLNIGGDYSSTHSEGIDPLLRLAGIKFPIQPFGLEDRTSVMPMALPYVETRSVSVRFRGPGEVHHTVKRRYPLTVFEFSDRSGVYPEQNDRNYIFSEKDLSHVAWGRSELVIQTCDPVLAIFLTDLTNAFENSNVFITDLRNASAFASSGFIIGIASRAPKDYRDYLEHEDLARFDLAKRVKKCGLIEKVKARYDGNVSRFAYALAPYALKDTFIVSRDGDRFTVNDHTAHDVAFFLNPRDQKNMKFGWFTVEELEQALDGQGPVFKRELEQERSFEL